MDCRVAALLAMTGFRGAFLNDFLGSFTFALLWLLFLGLP
jgi:hypothetical protein